MNTKSNRLSVIVIAAIMAVVATSLFFIVQVTPIFITAYVFALIGIALFCTGNLYILRDMKNYPWAAAFPMTIWQYLIAELTVSAVFVIRENLFSGSFPIGLFWVIHIALLAFFAVFLLLIKGGKEVIEKCDADVKEKTTTLRLMQTDVESLMRKFPEYDKDLRQVAEALRYSDPMSHSSLAAYEEQIQQGIIAMSSPEEDSIIPERCAELLRQIADRNSRVKILK